MNLPKKANVPKLPPKPRGGGAAARQQQFFQERGLKGTSAAGDAGASGAAPQQRKSPGAGRKPK